MTAHEVQHIDAAVTAHVQWLARLRAAVEAGTSELEPATVRQDHQCELGKWLHARGAATASESPALEDVRRAHAQFHVQAASILTLALAGRREEAERMIGPRSEFLALSGWLVLKVRALRSI